MAGVEIQRLGAAGDGISEVGFHPFTLPGELVAPGAPPRILRPSPDRVIPPCPHFGTCGGCSVQHASDAFVTAWKEDLLRRALSAHGLDATFRPTQTSPPHSRRRAVLTVRRTKKTVQIGFHRRGSDQIVDITTCMVLSPGFLDLRPHLETLARLGASRKGALKISVTASRAGWDLHVTGG
ncbi:MAG: class I SAM-dependent RNA methyltransferase, partial [Pseudomonadota bacterium]